ncbi:MAG TPA: hypothetical protein VGR97_10105 [Candidatus Acidoferrales bacterium]|nr:hypothetical protein [Candidatus Acidoferrales bacterium]
MNTPSRSLAGLKRSAGVVLFLFLAPAPRAFAQITAPIELEVVGDNSPVTPANWGFRHYCGPSNPDLNDFNNDIYECHLAQAFGLSSDAYVNGATLTLVAHAQGSGIYPVSVVITRDLNSGPVLLQQTELVAIPFSAVDVFIPVSFSFPVIFLPKGGYYLVVSRDESFQVCPPTGGCSLTWAPNQVGSTEVGTFGQAFCNNHSSESCPVFPVGRVWAPISMDPSNPTNLAGTNDTFAFELDGPFTMPPTGGGLSQIVRLVAGPVTPAPGVPVEAQLGFVDMNGNPIGPTSTVSIGPGQIQSLDLNLSQFVNQFGQHIEVQPFVAQAPNAAGAPSAASQLLVTTQILDALTGFETALTPVLRPGASAPALAPQVLAGGQTMRITVVASNTDPCNATLSLADKNGVALGPSEPVSVSPGTGTSLDLNANTLGLTFGRRIEVLPIVTPTAAPSPGGAPVNSVCQVTVEVFDHLTGRTESSQSTSKALPAVQ